MQARVDAAAECLPGVVSVRDTAKWGDQVLRAGHPRHVSGLGNLCVALLLPCLIVSNTSL